MTIRIDTARNRIDHTIAALARIRDEMPDLHVLAYERARASAAERVHGGTVDYALDAYGSTRARDMLGYLTELIVPICDLLDQTSGDILKFLNDGDSPQPRTRRTINATELKESLDAQARRRARGEYSPLRRHPQPRPGT